MGEHEYTLDELEALPTLTVGQVDNLKVDDGEGTRVWLCRCGVEDGMPVDNLVTVERYDDVSGRWETERTYEARSGQ